MANKIIRKTAKLFGISAGAIGVEEFASKQTTGSLVYSIDPTDIQTAAWSSGWIDSIYLGTFAPYYQDRNAVDLVTFYQIAYLLQQGIPEWDSGTIYFEDSVVQNGGGVYISLVDSNLNNIPPAGASNSYWKICSFPLNYFPPGPTCKVFSSGYGTYIPPVGCVRLFIRMVGGGGGGGGTGVSSQGGNGLSGGNTTLGSLTCYGGSYGTGGIAGYYAPGGAGGYSSGGYLNIFGGYGASVGAGYLDVPGGTSKLGSYPAPGSGGAGGGIDSGLENGGAGGAGGYLEALISNPTAMSFVVGFGGAGGLTGTPDYYPGIAGQSGIIIIYEFYF